MSLKAVQAMLEEMKPLALNWAKIPENAFNKWTKDLLSQTPEQLEQTHRMLANIYNNSFKQVKKIWNRLPAEQWDVTFALKMNHLDEYKDLRKALIEFKSEFMSPFKKAPKGVVPNIGA